MRRHALAAVSAAASLCVLLSVAALRLQEELATASGERDARQERTARVAVIGGGVGGAFASYFLWQQSQTADWDVQIDVFESDTLGGRARTFEYEGKVLELGASMVYAGNRYVAGSLRRLGLQRRWQQGTPFALYDGTKVVFESSGWGLATLLRLLARYQLALLRFALLPLRMLWSFDAVYGRQDAGIAYESPEAMLRDLRLYEWTQRSFADMLQDALGGGGPAAALREELLGSVNRVNYNQANAQLHAMVGLVSTLPLVDGRTFSIKGGNAQLAARLLGHARASVHERVGVARVTRLEDGRFALDASHAAATGPVQHCSACSAEQCNHGPYDAVVIAAPLPRANISFAGQFDQPLPPLPDIPYQTTVTSYVLGALNPAYFGLPAPPRGAVFVTDAARTPFTSIAPRATAGVKPFEKLYKIFSSQLPSAELLSALFHNHTLLASHAWAAYPAYDPPQRFAPFALHEGLYYNNAIEGAASAMEMAAIAGRNSALLVARQLEQARARRMAGGAHTQETAAAAAA